jgi:tetratricopeptide (TPR) repeat protein
MMSTEQRSGASVVRFASLGVLLGTLACGAACASAGAAGRRGATAAPAAGRPAPAGGALAAQTLESRDRRLAGALLLARLERTPEHLTAVGYVYYDLGLREAAMNYFSSSLAIEARYAPALDGAARVWRDWGLPAFALSSAHRATYFAPWSAEAWNTLGTVRQALDLDAEAAAAYHKALQLDPSAAYARSNLCYLAFLRGDGTSAADDCATALRSDSGFVPAANNLALSQAAGGDVDLAFDTFAAAGGKAVAHYNMGIVRLAQRRYPEAIVQFEAAYGVDPAFDRAYARAREARRLELDHRETPHADR